MPPAQIARIFGVVVEVLVGQTTVVVPNQPIRRDLGGIEFHLDLGILGHREEGARQFLHDHPPGLPQRVDGIGHTITVVGQHLHAVIPNDGCAVAKDGKTNAVAPLLLDQLDQFILAAGTDVEITIGEEQHPRDRPIADIPPRSYAV